MLGAVKNSKLFEGDIALQKLSKELGIEDKFEATNASVYFGDANVTEPDPYFNGQGPERKGCNFCGACMTGCRNNSKNSLDKNYLHLAQNYGAEIKAELEVYNVIPISKEDGSTGYEVFIKSSTKFFKKSHTIQTNAVIFSGGVLGTLKLLLKLKQKSLPNISDKLGGDIRTNNETLISVSSLEKNKNFSKGIAIGSILHTDENSHLEICRYSEGSNAWKLFHFPYVTGKNVFVRLAKVVFSLITSPLQFFKIYVLNSWAKSTVVLLFMQTLDSTIKLKRNIFGQLYSTMSNGKNPSPFIPESIKLTKAYSKIVNGKNTSFALETLAGIPSTAHILGGAVMSADATKGVIDKENRVFGYKNLFVIDGSMISANPGVNPSLSITAIAEMAMSKIPPKEK